jgi:hypothetical protein
MPEDKLSFIPQKTFEPTFYKRRGPGIIIVFSFLLFFISISAYGALFLYKNSLNKELNILTESLERAKAGFELSLINEVNQTSEKINYSKKLLEQHVSSVPIFDFLEKNTLKDVRFKSFKYSIAKNENPTVLLEGLSKNYSLLALQGDIFEKDKNIKSVLFSRLNLGEKGLINFTVKLILDPSMLIYKIEKEE